MGLRMADDDGIEPSTLAGAYTFPVCLGSQPQRRPLWDYGNLPRDSIGGVHPITHGSLLCPLKAPTVAFPSLLYRSPL